MCNLSSEYLLCSGKALQNQRVECHKSLGKFSEKKYLRHIIWRLKISNISEMSVKFTSAGEVQRAK